MVSASRNELFPVFLKVDELDILIVGGGNTGYEKLFFMLKSSPHASVTVVAESFHEDLTTLAASHERVTLVRKSFALDDVAGRQIVIAATRDKALNASIRTAAKTVNALVNVADTPALCDFYLGSIVTKGDLKIAISTNGKSPTFAKRFREVLEETLPDDLPTTLLQLRAIRDKLKGDFGQKVKRLNEITSVLTDSI